MPAPLSYAHRILEAMAADRHAGKRPEFEPDAKSQVTLKYENGKPVGVSSVVFSTQHKESVSQKDLRELVRDYVTGVLPAGWFPPDEECSVNPTDRKRVVEGNSVSVSVDLDGRGIIKKKKKK